MGIYFLPVYIPRIYSRMVTRVFG